jgi:hypothetical protein
MMGRDSNAERLSFDNSPHHSSCPNAHHCIAVLTARGSAHSGPRFVRLARARFVRLNCVDRQWTVDRMASGLAVRGLGVTHEFSGVGCKRAEDGEIFIAICCGPACHAISWW